MSNTDIVIDDKITVVKRVPFGDFSIDVWDNAASSGYSHTLHGYTEDSLKFLGSKYNIDPSRPKPPGSSYKKNFNFRPTEKAKSIVIIKHGRSWDESTFTYKAYVIEFE
jgi:hypothetical protein